MRKLLIAVVAATTITLGVACDPKGDNVDKNESTSQAVEKSPLEKFWSYQGSKVDSVNPTDARENRLETANFFNSDTINVGKSPDTPFLIVDKRSTSPDEPVGLAVSHAQDASETGEELILTTRVDKPGQHKLFGQFRSALGPCAVGFQGALPKGIDDAFWIHNSRGQLTGIVYRSDANGVTASMNFSRPQPKALLLAQIERIGPYIQLAYNAGYNTTPAS